MPPSLPAELYKYILEIKSKTAWEKRKAEIHKKIHDILPTFEHQTEFTFNDYNVYYIRTRHQDFTVILKRNNHFEISQVVYLFKSNPDSEVIHTTKFWYLPTLTFRGGRRGIRLPLPFEYTSEE